MTELEGLRALSLALVRPHHPPEKAAPSRVALQVRKR